MATHSSTLAWKIPWREYLVGYSPWGLKKLDTTEQPCLALPCLGASNGKESACYAGDPGSIPWSEKSPGEGNG